MQLTKFMSPLEIPQVGALHYDEIPYVRSSSYYDEEEPERVETLEMPLSALLDEDVNDPRNAPEPYLAMQKAVAQAAQEVLKEAPAVVIPPMPPTHPTETPEPVGLMMAGLFPLLSRTETDAEEPSAPEDPFKEHADFFSKEPHYETVQEPEVVVKTGWLRRLSEKFGSAMERFGHFLDAAVPPSMAAIVATTLGMAAPTVLSNTNHVGTQEAVAVSSTSFEAPQPELNISRMTAVETAPSVEPVSAPQTLWEAHSNPKDLNALLIEKNKEIVAVTGGERADYLYSTAAYEHLLKELSKPGRGFSAVLMHPETQKAENIAQLINLVETHFGEKVADLLESNAAAMHLSASQIQALR